MNRIDREIGGVGPDMLPLRARRVITDREARWEDFVESDVERDVLVRGGIRVPVAILPVESREKKALVSNPQNHRQTIAAVLTTGK